MQTQARTKPASRTRSKSEKAVWRSKQQEMQQQYGTVEIDDVKLSNCFEQLQIPRTYLGHTFQGDADLSHAITVRMAHAYSCFGELHHVWSCGDVNLRVKLRLYKAWVVAALTHGHEAWPLDASNQRRINGWNSKCLRIITGGSIHDEAKEPTVDLVALLGARRLRWAGHILRMDEHHLLRKVLLARCEQYTCWKVSNIRMGFYMYSWMLHHMHPLKSY